MAQAKWYALTPARQQLLIALVIAVVVFGSLLVRQFRVAEALRDASEPQNESAK